MTTLLLSQGVPMIRHGDELGHSQQGNNNAYCQDNELSWLDWEHADLDFVAFCADLVAFRHQHPVFWRRRFFEGEPIFGGELSDIAWFRPDGAEMTDDDWQAGFAKSLGVFLNGDALPDPDPRGRRLRDDSFLLLFNAHHEDVTFVAAGQGVGPPVGDRADHGQRPEPAPGEDTRRQGQRRGPQRPGAAPRRAPGGKPRQAGTFARLGHGAR